MGFDLCNCSMKIRESIETPTFKMGVHLGVWVFIPLHSYTFESMRCDSHASLLAHTFASPCLGRKPKARIATILIDEYDIITTFK